MSFTRRSFVLGAAAAIAAVDAVGRATPAAAADPYRELVDRRREFLTGGAVAAAHPALQEKRNTIDAEVAELLESFNRASGRTFLWPDLPVNGASNTAEVGNLGVTGNRITTLATAWASAGSEYYDDADLLADLQGALWFLSGQYRADRGRPGNWWFWEIGLPRQVADTLVLLGESVPAEVGALLTAAVRFHAPDPNVRRGAGFPETGRTAWTRRWPVCCADWSTVTRATYCSAAMPSPTWPARAGTVCSAE